MKVIVAAAGTAGHINPGIAIANKIKKENPKAEIVFIGTVRGLENDLVPRAGYRLETIEAYGIQKKISVQNIRNLFKTLKGFKEAEKIIEKEKPDLVIGTGGYICGAVLSAAQKKNIPTMLHESNAYPGLAVKFLAKKTDVIMVAFEEAKQKLKKKAKRVVVTGTPTKIKNIKLTDEEKEKQFKELGLTENLPIVLIFGGSQGAKAINEATLDIIKSKNNANYQIIWAPGKNQYDIVKSELERVNININNVKNTKILPYIYNMQEIMSLSDVVVARSGALTITEIAILGKPSILIPLPSSNANRQEDNAKVLEKLDAAKIILNDDLTTYNLQETINDLIKDKANLLKMGENARKVAIENVEDVIYEEVEKLLKKETI